MELKRSQRVASWEITVGQLTVAATLIARLTTVYWQIERRPFPLELFLASVFKSAVLAAVVLLYRRQLWPSHLMLAVWPIGFLYAWLGVHAPPPILALGAVIGIAFALGVHGTRTLRRAGALEKSVAPAA